MKAAFTLGLFIVLTSVTVFNSFAQQEFTVTTTTANTVASKSTIEMPGLANNPLAIIVATPLGDAETLNPHPIGAWYYNNKWNIFNTDHANMPAGLKFKLQVFLKPDFNHFLHIVTKVNLIGEGSRLIIRHSIKIQMHRSKFYKITPLTIGQVLHSINMRPKLAIMLRPENGISPMSTAIL